MNTRKIEAAYLKKTMSSVRPEGLPGNEAGYFVAHQRGDLESACHLGRRILEESERTLKAPSALFVADWQWLRVKIGIAPDETLCGSPYESANPEFMPLLPRLVVLYAHFTHYFWVDHKRSYRYLRQIFAQSFLRRPDFALMSLFLMVHLRTIAGRRIFQLRTASFLYRLAFVLRRRGLLMSPFCHDIIVAVFPYTCFVGADFRGMRDALGSSGPAMPPDPYFQTLFRITSLYSAAYAGEIIRTEKYCEIFRGLQEQGKLLRYQPVSVIMGYLPFCLRGYQHLIEEDFREFMLAHDPEKSDPLINSQVYRIASLIYTSLRQYDLAEEAILNAASLRQQANFESWRRVDDAITAAIRAGQPFESIREVFEYPKEDHEAYLNSGFLMSRLIDNLGHLTSDPRRFAYATGEILAEHLVCEFRVLAPAEAAFDERPKIRLLDQFLVFHGFGRSRRRNIERLLEILVPSLRSIERSVVRMHEYQKQLSEQQRNAAVARTVQMMAHDVRRPFTMIEMYMQMIKEAPAEEIRNLSREFYPEMRRSLDQVNGLIADVMEIGSRTEPQRCDVEPEELVENALRDAFLAHKMEGVEVSTRFTHTRQVSIDRRKVMRVFANVIANAVEAMGGKGELWLETEQGEGQVLFIVGNSGSFVAPDECRKIFEVFYTRGKATGTGLGLAIAKKVVEAHGGEITCRSSAARGTEFCFGLPAGAPSGSSTSLENHGKSGILRDFVAGLGT